MGRAFCPNPTQLADIFASWHPTTDGPDLLDFPDSADFAIHRGLLPRLSAREWIFRPI